MNDVDTGDRSYLGGASEFTALMTVVREIPNRSAIRAFGTPSAASLPEFVKVVETSGC